MPLQARSQFLPQLAYNGYTSSSELDAQHVSPHQTTIKRKRPHLKAMYLPSSSNMSWCTVAESCCEIRGFRRSVRLHLEEPLTGIPGTSGAAGHLKRLMNGKANCYTLLKRITRLKCVNSEVKSVKHLPHKGGSLNWVHGTMSEPPWKSH